MSANFCERSRHGRHIATRPVCRFSPGGYYDPRRNGLFLRGKEKVDKGSLPGVRSCRPLLSIGFDKRGMPSLLGVTVP